MRFLTRSLLGLFLLTLTVGLLAMAGNTLFQAWRSQADGGRGPGESRERVFTVEVMEIEPGTHIPEITTYGEVISGRTLEIRAAAAGAIVRLSDNFREGGFVEKGEVLFQTDPANAASRLAVTRNELAEAEADLADARQQLSLAEAEVSAAESQLELRRRAMERQDSLRTRGVGTDAAMETAELATSAAEQALLAKRLSLANAQARIARAETLVDRRRINVDEAERLLSDTTVRAEFAGVLADVTAVLGRLVNANERLGNLIDPDALEVAFRVSNEEFRALSTAQGGLTQARVRIEIGGLRFGGQIDRVSAAVGEGKTGREIFAKLGQSTMLTVRPGDFVSVIISEPAIDGVVLIPATAASAAGEVLLVGEGERLESGQVEILRKQGDNLLVRADGLAGRSLVRARAPQLGAGIKVRPRSPGAPTLEAAEMVQLDPERRDRLVAAVSANTRMPADVRDRILTALKSDEVPRDMVDRIEARMAAAPGGTATPQPTGDADTVAVSEDQRQRMIAFIRSNDRIPDDRKAQILETLQQDRLPRDMVDRITQRMGG